MFDILWQLCEWMNQMLFQHFIEFCIIVAVLTVLAIIYDKYYAKKMIRPCKHVIKIMGSEVYTATILTELQNFLLEYEDVEYEITHAGKFRYPKKIKWESFYNNWFMNRLPLRLFKKIIKRWNWYEKYIILFPKAVPEEKEIPKDNSVQHIEEPKPEQPTPDLSTEAKAESETEPIEEDEPLEPTEEKDSDAEARDLIEEED